MYTLPATEMENTFDSCLALKKNQLPLFTVTVQVGDTTEESRKVFQYNLESKISNNQLLEKSNKLLLWFERFAGSLTFSAVPRDQSVKREVISGLEEESTFLAGSVAPVHA